MQEEEERLGDQGSRFSLRCFFSDFTSMKRRDWKLLAWKAASRTATDVEMAEAKEVALLVGVKLAEVELPEVVAL